MHNTSAAATIINSPGLSPAPPTSMTGWLDFEPTCSTRFIAEKTCEMICHMWLSVEGAVHEKSSSSDGKTELDIARKMPPSATFILFMQKLLETTQLSQSVIVLALHYIHRLKEKISYTPALLGSEFGVAVTGFLIADKFLDDNKNTTWPGPRNNKTWSELSGISLGEINGMEREFLLGMDFRLYVDEATYAIWLSHIKVLARSFLHGVGGVHASSSARTHHPHQGQGYSQLGSTSLLTRTFTIPAAPVVANGSADLSSMHRRSADTTTGEGSAYPSRDRARSTSPGPFTFSSYTSRSRGVSHQQEPHPLTQQTSVPQEVLVRQEFHYEEPSPWSDQRYQPVHPATPTVSSMDDMSSTTPTSKDIPISGSSTAATRKLTGTFPWHAFIRETTREGLRQLQSKPARTTSSDAIGVYAEHEFFIPGPYNGTSSDPTQAHASTSAPSLPPFRAVVQSASKSPAAMVASSDQFVAPSSQAKTGKRRQSGAGNEDDDDIADCRPTKKFRVNTTSPATLYDSDGEEVLEETECGAQASGRRKTKKGPRQKEVQSKGNCSKRKKYKTNSGVESDAQSAPQVAKVAAANTPTRGSRHGPVNNSRRHFHDPVPIDDKDGQKRWKFACRYCNCVRTFVRTIDSGSFNDEPTLPRLNNLATHINECQRRRDEKYKTEDHVSVSLANQSDLLRRGNSANNAPERGLAPLLRILDNSVPCTTVRNGLESSFCHSKVVEEFTSVTSRIAYAFDTRATRQTTPALACTVGCFINEDWELIERVLDVKPLGDKGNEGVYGGMAFVRGARNLTTDSAPVNDVIVGTAVRSVHDEDGVPYTPDMHIHCIDHIINIVAQAFLAGLDLGMTPVRKLHIVTTKIVSSHRSRLRFRQIAKDTYRDPNDRRAKLMVVRDVGTRWNYAHAMIERAVLLYEAVDKWMSNHGLPSAMLSLGEWIILHHVRACLEMFKNATAGISVSSRPTIPYVLPVYQMMQVKLEEWEGDMKLPPAIRLASAQAHRKLQKFKSMADKNECFIIGNILSPYMRGAWFANTRSTAEAQARQDGTFTAEDLFRHVAETYFNNSVTRPSTPSLSFLAAACNSHVPSTPAVRSTPEEIFREELKRYLAFEGGRGNLTDPLGWWKIHAAEFPTLARMARDFLAIPATSVSVQRTSSLVHICRTCSTFRELG